MVPVHWLDFCTLHFSSSLTNIEDLLPVNAGFVFVTAQI